MDLKSQPTLTVEPTSDSDKANKSGGGADHIFKLTFFMLRRRRSKKSKETVDMGSDKGMWRRLLGSMRPLHIQGNESPPPTAAKVDKSSSPSKPKEEFEESPMALPSVLSSSSSSISHVSRCSSFGTSQYASANSDGDDDDNAIEDDGGGDEMIDAKAEEFIAQFYEQIRRQRHNY